MRGVISACTNKAFSGGSMPLAHLKARPINAVNDNTENFFALRPKRAAYGRSGLIIAVTALVTGIIALPLLQGLSMPLVTASEGRPEVLRGSPIAPVLLQP